MSDEPVDRSKSIEELSGYWWFAPDFESRVVLTSHAMRRKPLDSLTLEDMRMGVMQQVGLTWLVPVALEAVEKDPFAQSMNFEAEITLQLLRVPHEFWVWHPAWRDRLQRVYERVEEGKDDQDEYWRNLILPEDIRKAHAQFRGEIPSKRWLRPLEIDHERELWPSGRSSWSGGG